MAGLMIARGAGEARPHHYRPDLYLLEFSYPLCVHRVSDDLNMSLANTHVTDIPYALWGVSNGAFGRVSIGLSLRSLARHGLSLDQPTQKHAQLRSYRCSLEPFDS
jgi:hypothetical protein